jgi:eukaryotic-like serine/threonine-protein kinase
MPIRIEPNAEPIPGYRLIERLGGGGFGEVWKAEAPGGLFKAIKFVYGELESTSGAFEDPSRAEQELKALSRVKTVHHPYILSLERYDIIDNQLVIVMELADRTLWDRFRECRTQGLPGIPRDELLKYMQETSEALDLMNSQFQLQHLDIKPQNLFLVFNHIKVADFGLVKDLGSKGAATVTGGVTPVYAAPETFDGWLSRFSDQYSLAIVYQELLTGQRPFTGGTMRQLVLQHIQGKPDLAPLPLADRPVVSRALAKNPDERYPTCVDFVGQLRAATVTFAAAPAIPVAPTGHAPAAGMPPPSAAGSTPARPAEAPADLLEPPTQGARGLGLGRPAPLVVDGPSADEAFVDRPQILPPRPGRTAAPAPEAVVRLESAPAHFASSAITPRPGAPIAAPSGESGGVLQPALVIGLGKLGLQTLCALRQRLNIELGGPDAVPQLRLLGIDTDPETLQEVGQSAGAAGLRSHEAILARLHRPSHYIKSKCSSEQWLNPKLIYRIPREQASAGIRALGRLALVDNIRVVYKRLEAELQACCAPDTLVETGAQADLAPRSQVPRVYIVTCLAGNAGSGMFLDVAYLARHLLRKLGMGAAEIVGLFYLPQPGRAPAQRGAALANSYAALMELNHFARGNGSFVARYPVGDDGRIDLHEDGAPFQRCLLLNLPDARGAISDAENGAVTALAGDFLYRDLATALGHWLDGQHHAYQGGLSPAERRRESFCQSFGLYRLTWPRLALLDGCARKLCGRLLARWMSKDARAVADLVGQWTQEQMEALQLRPEHLIGRMHEWCENSLKQPIERFFANLTAGSGVSGGGARPSREESPSFAGLLQLAQQLETQLGIPEECRTPQQAPGEPGFIERLLAQGTAKLGNEMEQKVAELAVVLIEDPNFRLAGAEEALRQFTAGVEQALQSQEALAKELQERAALLYQKIQRFSEAPTTIASPTTSVWKPTFIRRTAAHAPNPLEDFTELLRTYAKARYHSLVLAQINRFYVALRGQLSDQVREVGFCRQRLGELATLVQPQEASVEHPHATSQVRLLLPAACLKLEDAFEQIDRTLTAQDVADFDVRAQEMIRHHFRALVQVCMGSSSTVRAVAPLLIRQAERFLEPRLEGSSVAEMYFAYLGSTYPSGAHEAAASELWTFYDKAQAQVGDQTSDEEIALIAVPNDARGREFRGLLEANLPTAHVLMTSRTDEIVFYRERLNIALGDLEQVGLAGQEAYRLRAAHDPAALHCREDITDWQPLALVEQ